MQRGAKYFPTRLLRASSKPLDFLENVVRNGYDGFHTVSITTRRRAATAPNVLRRAGRTYRGRFSMKRTMAAMAVMLFALTARADQQTVYRLRALLDDLGRFSADLTKEANRLADAARAPDDWQKNNGVSKAMDAIGKAAQLASQQPQNPKVQRIVQAAHDIVAPAREGSMNIDKMKIRGELRRR